jgi:acyl-coenzyme A thioesterase PaaI-like protein
MSESIGPTLRKNWQRLAPLPGGKWLFSRLVGFTAPYSDSIKATVQELVPGHGVITLKETRRIRNHLWSVHAIAIANLAELVTGLTLMNSLPPGMRGILIGIEMEYLKKARGLLTAECDCDIPVNTEKREFIIQGQIRNSDNAVVAIGRARWLIGPEKSTDA